MIPPPDPGIFLRGEVVLATAPGTVVTSGVVEIVYTPSGVGGQAVVATADLRPVVVGGKTYSFEVSVPAGTELPGYPVDPSKALRVPTAATVYTRTIRIDGVTVSIESSSSGELGTVTLDPDEVRASYETIRVVIGADWFERGDLNSDGKTDTADWTILQENWQQEWRGRLLDLEAYNHVLDNFTPPVARREPDPTEESLF